MLRDQAPGQDRPDGGGAEGRPLEALEPEVEEQLDLVLARIDQLCHFIINQQMVFSDCLLITKFDANPIYSALVYFEPC